MKQVTYPEKMPEAVRDIYEDMLHQIDVTRQEEENPVTWIEMAITLCDVHLKRMTEYYSDRLFASKTEEITFFKFIKPAFYCHRLFYHKLYHFTLGLPITGMAGLKEYYQKALYRLTLDFENHFEFYQYYRSGSTYLDEEYFIRGSSNKLTRLKLSFPDIDTKAATGYDYMVAKLYASEMLSDFLNEQMRELDGVKKQATPSAFYDKEIFTWRGPVIWIVEFIYGLYALNPFQDERVNITNLTSFVSTTFNIPITAVHKKMEEIRLRSQRTLFTDLFKQQLLRQMEKDDEKKPRK